MLPLEKKALDELIRDLRLLLKDDLIQFFIFGSKVRGEAKIDSDIDLLAVVKTLDHQLREKIYSIVLENELTYDSHFSLKVMSEFEFKRNIQLGSFFIQNVQNEGIAL